jgi:hypothetical protein
VRVCARACVCVCARACVCAHKRVPAPVCPSESVCPCPLQFLLPTSLLCSQSCARPGSPTPPKPRICHPVMNAGLGNEKQGFCPRKIFYYYFSLLIGFSISHFSHTSSLVENSGLCKAQKRLCLPGPLANSPSLLTGHACSVVSMLPSLVPDS